MSSTARSVEVSGLRLHVREGRSGRPLLLINGIGAHLEMWANLERALAGARVIAFDAPGTGRSAESAIPLGFDSLAVLVEQLLDRLGHERVDVLGYSWGGVVAQHLARRAPGRVRRMVLAGTTPGWGGVPGSMWTLSQMSTPLRYYWRAYYDSVVGELMGGRARSDRAFVRRHGDARQRNPPTPNGYLAQLLAITTSRGTLPWLGEVEAQTLVIAGDDDPVVPVANALVLARYLPNARLFVAEGEGHLLLMDDQSAALPVIDDFLGAPELGASEAWRDARVVDDHALEDALRADPPGFENPAAVMSAFVRSFWPPPERTAP